MSDQERANALIEQANALHNGGDPVAAAPLYVEAAGLFAPYASFALVAGDSYRAAGLHPRAVEATIPGSFHRDSNPHTNSPILGTTTPHWSHYSSPMPELLQHLQSPILVASDGSVTEHRSSFGWVLATREGQRLLSSRGPAPGALASYLF